MQKRVVDKINDWIIEKIKQNPWMKNPLSWLFIGILSFTFMFAIGTEGGGIGNPDAIIAIPFMFLFIGISFLSFVFFIVSLLNYLTKLVK